MAAETNMSDVWTLLGLCLAMLVGCYLAGSIPLAFSLSEVSYVVSNISFLDSRHGQLASLL